MDNLRVFKSGPFVDVIEQISLWAKKNNISVHFRFDDDTVIISFERRYKRIAYTIKHEDLRTTFIGDELENIYGLLVRKGEAGQGYGEDL